jgi:NAD(P)-dependent dehydrogenase (short-subunit alcohol dehydrogenase family)
MRNWLIVCNLPISPVLLKTGRKQVWLCRGVLTSLAGIPIGRLGYPEEIAETVVWMVKTGYVTNKVVGVDGGFFVQ